MLTFTNLSIGYGTKTVASGLSGTLEKGTFTALVGRNGSGKSTLLRTLAGLQEPLAGEIILNGKNLKDYSSKELARQRAVVLTHVEEVAALTVRQMVETGRTPYTNLTGKLSEEDDNIVRKSLEITELENLADTPLTHLSDGQRQRAFIAVALAQTTPMLFLDEPSAYLDYESRETLYILLKRLAEVEGKCILCSTHDLDAVRKISGNVFEI